MSVFAENLRALGLRSPDVAAALEPLAGLGEFSVSTGVAGHSTVDLHGRPLDSRRDPHGSARRQVSAIEPGPVVVVGLGGGYLVEALLDTHHPVTAIVESRLEAIAAAMHARDVTRVLSEVPVIIAGSAADPDPLLIRLKARASQMVCHGPRVAADATLAALAARWSETPSPARPPRVLVVGPVYGGSLETARATARACKALGAATRFLDWSPFADGWHALSGLPVGAAGRTRLQAELARVLGEAVVELSAEWRPDLVLAIAQAPLNRSVTDRLQTAGVRTAFWFVENHRVLPYWQQVAGDYDVFFAIQDEPFLSRLREAGARKAVYMPTACDAGRHVPVALTEAERIRFAADVSFAGAPYLNRQRILMGLLDFRPRIWGEGWAQTELAPAAAEGGRRFSLDEMTRVFAATRINLNIHSANHVEGLDPDPDYVNPRTFELAACGAFQLVDARRPLPALFADDELAMFDSMTALRERIRYFLERPDERSAMAGRARARALAEHTFEHRVRRIFQETLPPELASSQPGAVRPAVQSLDEAIAALAGGGAVMTNDEAMLRVLRHVRDADV